MKDVILAFCVAVGLSIFFHYSKKKDKKITRRTNIYIAIGLFVLLSLMIAADFIFR